MRSSSFLKTSFLLLLALSSGCQDTVKKATSQSLAAESSDTSFGSKFCDDIVDPLQQGSHHWMACHKEVDSFAEAGLTPSELVLQTCAALRDIFVRPDSFLACQQGGLALVRSESFAEPVKDMFERTARSLIACYENVGVILSSYDEEGRCTESGELSGWNMSSDRKTIAMLEEFTSLDSRVPTVGSYLGKVNFYNAEGRNCSFALDFTYSGEDITVVTDGFACR